jgi:hypothetical protein
MKKTVFIFDSIVKFATLIGLGLQFLPISDVIKKVTVYCIFSFAIVALILSIFSYYKNRKKCGRKELIKRGIAMLSNTKDKVILFGGDLSWTDDYIKAISLLSKNNKEIEIFYPLTKYTDISEGRKQILDRRINSLIQAGAKVFSIPKDYGLRCFIVDPDFSGSNKYMQVMITERFKGDLKNKNHNKYLVQSFGYDIGPTGQDSNRNICMGLKIVYDNIKKDIHKKS